jgi:hypothetical protein
MPQTAEYKVISSNDTNSLQHLINAAAMEGWKPILMTSAAMTPVIVNTVILEHKIGS